MLFILIMPYGLKLTLTYTNSASILYIAQLLLTLTRMKENTSVYDLMIYCIVPPLPRHI